MLPAHYLVDFLITGLFLAACLAPDRLARKSLAWAVAFYLTQWMMAAVSYSEMANDPINSFMGLPGFYTPLVRLWLPAAILAVYVSAVRLRRGNAAMSRFLLVAGFVAVLDWFYLAFGLTSDLFLRKAALQSGDLAGFAAANRIVCAVLAAALVAGLILGELFSKRARLAIEQPDSVFADPT